MNRLLKIFSIVSIVGIAGGGWLLSRYWMHPVVTHVPLLKEVHDDEVPDISVPQPRELFAAQPPAVVFSLSTQSIYDQPLIRDGKFTCGATIPKVGVGSLTSKPMSDGIFLAFNHLNTHEHGIHGAHIALDQRDDGGLASAALIHIQEILKKTRLFFGVAGEDVLEKSYDLLLQKGALALLFPATGRRSLFASDAPVLFFRPSYAHEIAALIYYARTVLKKEKFAIFYEESGWALEAKDAAAAMLKTVGDVLVSQVFYQPETVTIGTAVDAIKKSEPHVVLCFASGRPTYNFIREAINKQLHYVSFLGLSNLASIAPHLKKSRGIAIVTSSVVPNPFTSQLPIVKEYRDAMQRYLPNKGLSLSSLEGYIMAMLCASLIAQLKPDACIQDLFDHIKQIRNGSFSGLSLTYCDRSLSQSVWINEGMDRRWVEYVVGDVA